MDHINDGAMGRAGQEVTQRPGSEVEGKYARDAGLERGDGLDSGGRGKGTGKGFAKTGTVRAELGWLVILVVLY